MTKDWVHGVGHFHIYQILLQIVMRTAIKSSPPAWTKFCRNVVDSSWLPFLQWLYGSLHVFAKDRVLALWLYTSEQCSAHRLSSCRSSVRHFPERSWTVVAFPCFSVSRVDTPSYCCSSSDFLQSHYTVLLSTFLFAFFMHLLMLFTSFFLFFFEKKIIE